MKIVRVDCWQVSGGIWGFFFCFYLFKSIYDRNLGFLFQFAMLSFSINMSQELVKLYLPNSVAFDIFFSRFFSTIELG